VSKVERGGDHWSSNAALSQFETYCRPGTFGAHQMWLTWQDSLCPQLLMLSSSRACGGGVRPAAKARAVPKLVATVAPRRFLFDHCSAVQIVSYLAACVGAAAHCPGCGVTEPMEWFRKTQELRWHCTLPAKAGRHGIRL